MCRSLRELNRPMPCADWSQGPHEGWEVYGGRVRTSPTPDEIRLQAYHALSSRITSLYWFNLSLKSLLKFPDTWAELARVGREIRLLDDFYLEGNAYRYARQMRDGRPDWDVASISAPQGALLLRSTSTIGPTKATRRSISGRHGSRAGILLCCAGRPTCSASTPTQSATFATPYWTMG